MYKRNLRHEKCVLTNRFKSHHPKVYRCDIFPISVNTNKALLEDWTRTISKNKTLHFTETIRKSTEKKVQKIGGHSGKKDHREMLAENRVKYQERVQPVQQIRAYSSARNNLELR